MYSLLFHWDVNFAYNMNKYQIHFPHADTQVFNSTCLKTVFPFPEL